LKREWKGNGRGKEGKEKLRKFNSKFSIKFSLVKEKNFNF